MMVKGIMIVEGDRMKDKRRTEFDLPLMHEPYTDKYFLRSSKILKAEGIDPRVRYQVFIRKGPGITAGIDEAIAAIVKYSPEFIEHGGKIHALQDGVHYEPLETLMTIEGPVQDLVELETIYLSAISERTSITNGMGSPNPWKITETVTEIMDILEKSRFGPRPLSYFGARHYGSEWDAALAKAAYDGGATAASTDMGASQFGKKGGGTTPHALLLGYASLFGIEDYQVKVMEAFRKHIDHSVPTVFLADTFNREITDTLKVAETLGDDFHGPRFDTNGAAIAEGGIPFDGRKYWTGKGVTVAGVLAARRAFDEHGFKELEIALTSGFSNPEKVRVFTEAEEKYDRQLFSFLGAGFADNRYTATSDIMGYFRNGEFIELHKVGRPIRPNPKLEEVDLTDFEA